MKCNVVIISLCLLVLLSSCAKLEDAGYEAGKKIGTRLLGETPEEDSVDLFCLRKANNLIKDEVVLLEISDEWYLKSYEFADGKVDSAVSIRYRAGNQQGERLQYVYPDNFLERNYVKYVEQRVSENGLIKGDFIFKAKLILEKVDEPQEILTNTSFGKEIPSQKYFVVNKEIIECNDP